MDSDDVAEMIGGVWTLLMGSMALVGMFALVVWLCKQAF